MGLICGIINFEWDIHDKVYEYDNGTSPVATEPAMTTYRFKRPKTKILRWIMFITTIFTLFFHCYRFIYKI